MVYFVNDLKMWWAPHWITWQPVRYEVQCVSVVFFVAWNVEATLRFICTLWVLSGWFKFKCNYLNVVSTPYFQFYQLCLAKGFVCEYCKNGDDIIYPFEVKKCTQCPGNVFPACFFLFLACVFSCFIFSPSLTVFHFLHWKKNIVYCMHAKYLAKSHNQKAYSGV